MLASQKLNVVLVNVKTAVSCLNKVIFARSLRSRAYCSSVNTVQNPNSVPALTFGCSIQETAPATGASPDNEPDICDYLRYIWQALFEPPWVWGSASYVWRPLVRVVISVDKAH